MANTINSNRLKSKFKIIAMRLKLLKIHCVAILLLLLNVSCTKDREVDAKDHNPPVIEEPDQGNYTLLTKKLLNNKRIISSVI